MREWWFPNARGFANLLRSIAQAVKPLATLTQAWPAHNRLECVTKYTKWNSP